MKIPIPQYNALQLAEALHESANTVIEQVGTCFDIDQLHKKPLQPGEERLQKKVDAIALALAVARIKATAEVFGVASDDLVRVLKYPKEGVRRYKLLARIAQFVTRMPSLLYPEDPDAKGGQAAADEGASDDDHETDDELERLEAAVKAQVETACWARDETEIAIDELEQSFRALIKAKDARSDE
jgi:hypothetical protein